MKASFALPPDLARALAPVRSVGVITGAGVSAESGIRTYRGKGGVYDDPDEGDRTVEALSGDTLLRDPDRTWRTVAELARQRLGATPNPAHEAIVAIERHVERFVLLTQNVDGLHQRAGSRNVIAIHGDVSRTRCMTCDRRDTLVDPASITAAPRCPACAGVVRPDVVLFGEMLPIAELQRIRRELLEGVPDVVIVAGTTALFPYIMEPVVRAATLGRLTIEVNPEETVLSEIVRCSLRATAGAALPAIADAILAGR